MRMSGNNEMRCSDDYGERETAAEKWHRGQRLLSRRKRGLKDHLCFVAARFNMSLTLTGNKKNRHSFFHTANNDRPAEQKFPQHPPNSSLSSSSLHSFGWSVSVSWRSVKSSVQSAVGMTVSRG